MNRIKLTTTGRRTNEPRSVWLYAFEDGDRLVVVGSLGGAPQDPAWSKNLRAEPRATVTSGGRQWPVLAHEVAGHERDRLWALVCDGFPMYRSFQRRTERLIPLFVLEPAG